MKLSKEFKVQRLFKNFRKIVVLVVGATIIMIGIALLVLPGPGMLTIAAGLGVLSIEFLWARYALKKLKTYSQQQFKRVQKKLDKDHSSLRK